ncbi:MAG: hypothetical protein HUJ79_02385, partial [Firmicutes bacterium]|nr:hypothetical protein [Bacillota bacterium]
PLGLRQVSPQLAKAKLSDNEYAVFELLRERGEMSIDEVCIHLDRPPAYVNPIVSVMEMKGFVFSAMGKIFLANV